MVLQENLVLSPELKKQIGYRKEFLKQINLAKARRG